MSRIEFLILALVAAAYVVAADPPAPINHAALAAQHLTNWRAP